MLKKSPEKILLMRIMDKKFKRFLSQIAHIPLSIIQCNLL